MFTPPYTTQFKSIDLSSVSIICIGFKLIFTMCLLKISLCPMIHTLYISCVNFEPSGLLTDLTHIPSMYRFTLIFFIFLLNAKKDTYIDIRYMCLLNLQLLLLHLNMFFTTSKDCFALIQLIVFCTLTSSARYLQLQRCLLAYAYFG